MQTNTYEGLHIINKKQSITSDELVIEAPLQININSESYTVVMRTPGNDQDLVLGLLYAEDIYKDSLPVPFEIIEEKFNIPSIVNVTIAPNILGNGYLNKRTLLSVSSCGICGKQQLEDIKVSGDKIEHKIIPSGNDTFNYVVLEPFGVSLLIVPWNYPVSIFSGMVAQNLIVGNTIVIKPPELCPISSNFYGKIFQEVGVPDGVINIVHGHGEITGRKLVQHPGCDYIVFTGSPQVASEILKETADRIIPTHFELGGKSAAIIYPDADIFTHAYDPKKISQLIKNHI